jgi:hypothetical protein
MAGKNYSERANLRTQPPWLRSAGILALLACAHLITATKGLAQTPSSEYQAKATCLFNFLKFVEWPEDAFPDPFAPIVIGIVGSNPFGNALSHVAGGKTVQGRTLVIRIYRVGEDMRGTHILFISSSEEKRLPEILSSLRGSSVLTVADMDRFLAAGGMIQLLIEGNQVRFTIDVNATSHARLKLSSKLLTVARAAWGNGKEGNN